MVTSLFSICTYLTPQKKKKPKGSGDEINVKIFGYFDVTYFVFSPLRRKQTCKKSDWDRAGD